MTVWLDTAAPAASSLVDPPNGPSPAAQAQQTLQELLGTEEFLVDVGHLGPLANYLQQPRRRPRGSTERLPSP